MSRRLLVSITSATAVVAAAWACYFIPHLQACALPLVPGFVVSALLFYRDGVHSIPNVAFIAFETLLNLSIYTLAVWMVLCLMSRRRTRSALASVCAAMAMTLLVLGCKSAPAPTPAPSTSIVAKSTYPPRPTVTPPPFRVFHTTDNSITLVTDDNATDDQIAAILWQLHDAAHNNTFAALHVPQQFVDKRDPMVWFHIYRGPKCASEKYTTGAYPCGASYHAAGDYTLGSFSNKDRDDAVLLHGDDKQTELWNPDTPH